MMLTMLKWIGFMATGLLGLIFICFLLYTLAVSIVVAGRKIKEEVQKNERNE